MLRGSQESGICNHEAQILGLKERLGLERVEIHTRRKVSLHHRKAIPVSRIENALRDLGLQLWNGYLMLNTEDS
ncbi:hypothetical protein SUGI_1078040 [Cryptomeria japonica]|nr:hypothetical protein SUGI_1078040 [Cryptomeria japonica]